MRLIDADELLKILQEQQKIGSVNDSRGRAKAILEVIHAPTIEAEPVRHAKWYAPASCDPCEWCSYCHERTRWFFDDFCPCCGAKMDGDDNDKSGEVHNQTQ